MSRDGAGRDGAGDMSNGRGPDDLDPHGRVPDELGPDGRCPVAVRAAAMRRAACAS